MGVLASHLDATRHTGTEPREPASWQVLTRLVARPVRPEGTVQGSTIRSVEMLVASPGRTFVTVRVTTPHGFVGTPDERAYLPVNRLKDGSVHDW